MKAPDPEDDTPGFVPTIDEERHFLAQCDYINRTVTATGRMVRRLLRQRNWREDWSEADQDSVWVKTFPDGTTEHLEEWDAYCCEEEYARDFFRDANIPMKPRPKSPPR